MPSSKRCRSGANPNPNPNPTLTPNPNAKPNPLPSPLPGLHPNPSASPNLIPNPNPSQVPLALPLSRYRAEHEDPVFEPERGVDPDDVAEKERDELAGLVYFDTENMLPVGKHPWKDTQKLFGAFFAKTAAVFTITAAVSTAPFSGVTTIHLYVTRQARDIICEEEASY